MMTTVEGKFMKTPKIRVVMALLFMGPAYSQNRNEIAEKLANPVGYVSVPFQNNFDLKIRPNDGFKWTMNLQPVIPFRVHERWNLINRITLPLISQRDVFGKTRQTGIGDVVVNVLLSPRKRGIIWGAGPAFYLPAGSDELLTSKKWGLGPNFLIIKRSGRFTLGALYFHAWSFAGSDRRPDLSFSYAQPFVTCSFRGGWGLGIVSEMVAELKSRMTNGSVIFTGSKTVRIGGQLAQVVLGPKLYFGNFNKPHAGIRASIIFLFP
jgi:hypothetical protein